ncbi:trimeric LpxA-like protein [Amniculicola lignicola CBS 123094]|uniref:Dynactin subunit 6 n=1 Tax=Amniculicola lignicola CBS 123094 TaxID=1392246 RepID=A0A6A5W783_9PLEO|nr:trimeric LpxA-like protein [Amniculicola lignicola CBS 123094]
MSTQPAPAARPSSDRRTSTLQKRTSTALPKPSSIVLDPSVLIAQHAQLTGTHPITIGPGAVLHPHSKISSVLAPVVLGEGVVIYERARIGVGVGDAKAGDANRRTSVLPDRGSGGSLARGEGTVLGRNVVVETNCVVEASEIGEGSVVEAACTLGRGCVIGRYCIISAASVIPANTRLDDFTVVYSGNEKRINQTMKDRKEVRQSYKTKHAKQLDMFRKLIPNQLAKWA